MNIQWDLHKAIIYRLRSNRIAQCVRPLHARADSASPIQ